MKKHFVFIALLVLIFFSGCNIFGLKDVQQKYTFSELTIDRVELPDSVKLGQAIQLRVSGDLPDASWSFDRFEIEREGNSFTIRVYGKKDNEIDVVIMILARFEATTEIQVDESGHYFFHFPGQTQYLDEEKSTWNTFGKYVVVVP